MWKVIYLLMTCHMGSFLKLLFFFSYRISAITKGRLNSLFRFLLLGNEFLVLLLAITAVLVPYIPSPQTPQPWTKIHKHCRYPILTSVSLLAWGQKKQQTLCFQTSHQSKAKNLILCIWIFFVQSSITKITTSCLLLMILIIIDSSENHQTLWNLNNISTLLHLKMIIRMSPWRRAIWISVPFIAAEQQLSLKFCHQ